MNKKENFGSLFLYNNIYYNCMIETIDRLSKKYPDVDISATLKTANLSISVSDIFIDLTFKDNHVISFRIENKSLEEQIEEKILGYKRLIRIKKFKRIC